MTINKLFCLLFVFSLIAPGPLRPRNLSAGATNDPLSQKMLSGELGGVGVMITKKDNEPLRIVSTKPESPAEKAGIKAPCFIISVNGTNLVHASFTESRSIMLGPVGSAMTLELADLSMTKTNKYRLKRERMLFPDNKSDSTEK